MFDGEHGIALHAMRGSRASSHGEGEFSYIFLSCSGNLGYILELRRGWPFKTRACSATSGVLSSYNGHRRNLRCWNWCSSSLETGVSGNLWSCLKEVKPLVMYDVECGMAPEPMKGNRASSRVDLGYTELFCIPVA